MIKVFGTTGTSNFPELVTELDNISNENLEITCQIAGIKYKPKNITYFKFTKNINYYYLNFDVFVCHAGAGTIFSLLELGKKIIVAPNPNFKDQHQKDICKFVESNNLGFVAWNINDIETLILKITDHTFSKYTNSNSEIGFAVAQIIINGK